YYVKIYDYDYDAAGNPVYLTSSGGSGSGSTAATPVNNASTVRFENLTGSGATLKFTAGSGTGGYRLLVMKEGSPVDFIPTDLVKYSSSSSVFKNGQEPSPGNYVIYGQTNNTSSLTVTGLTAGVTYYAALFEFNGNYYPVYKTPGATAQVTIPNEPTQPATSFLVTTQEGNALRFQWSGGNGARKLIIARKGQPVTAVPADGSTYTASANFDEGTAVQPGQYVVFDGANQSMELKKLEPGSTYYFSLFDYNLAGGVPDYLVSSFYTANGSTVSKPASGSTSASAVAGLSSMNISWTSGPGTSRLVVVKEGATVSSQPADLTKYSASNLFKSGAQLSAGEYVVFNGTSNSVSVSGLQAGKTYYYSIFDYNGYDAPVYNTANSISGSALVAASLPVKWRYVVARDNNNYVNIDWGTAREDKTAFFVVERSTDGGAFIALDTVRAAGGDRDMDYHAVDAAPVSGNSIYRVKEVDIDGRYDYSIQVALKRSQTGGGLSLYPNPARSSVRVSLPGGMEKAQLQVYTISGALVRNLRVQRGQTIGLDGLKAGIYTVTIQD
ncbi:MAG: T9SS type A sorting domain-containing protein, partial [Bacteroidetes bacterium]|nr:T9SS type A sorting domain-containing protein [Bacteroidota bacterium]